MLVNLHVKNLALIEEADINFEQGLNILTGETGAGKSILIGSINVALGGKVNADFIRKGAQYGLVELTFSVHSTEKLEALKKLDLVELEQGMVIISRKIMPGRTVIKVNGETKTVTQVKEIAGLLIDIHGQHEHHSLLFKNNYLSIIDRFAGNDAIKLLSRLKDTYFRYQAIQSKLDEFTMDTEQLNREMDYIQYELNEIEQANLVEGEDIELESLFKKFHNSRKIMGNIVEAQDMLTQKDQSVSDLMSGIYRNIAAASDYDKGLSDIFSQVRDLENLINDLGADISAYISSMEFDEEEYQKVEERLSFLNKLKQKYGNSISDILEYRDKQRERFSQLNDYEENHKHLQHQLDETIAQALKECEQLTAVRKNAAVSLTQKITNALKELNFLDVQFEITFEKTSHFSANGNDEVDFMISTNPGESMKPISNVASGGELSRIMLAIKTVLANKDDIETLIFDEIDTGISGRTAQMVSEKLNEISRSHQVLCITHLPQIAAMADYHYLIEKQVNGQSTVTNICALSSDEMIMELARLLGGVSITENVINNAKEMKDLALLSKTSKMI